MTPLRASIGVRIGLALLIVSVLGGVKSWRADATPKGDAIGFGVGYWPPDFTAKDLAGHRQTLQQYQGRVVVLHFWASWCPYCRGEIPKLKQVEQRWTPHDVSILAVSTDHDVDTLKQFIDQQRLSYPVIADAQADFSISEQYGISGIPVTYVIGKDGRIVSRLHGSSDIAGTVQTALAK